MTDYRAVMLNVDSARELVRLASRCDFDVDAACSARPSYIVDAKSLLGVLGLDMRAPILISGRGHNEELEQFLRQHAVAA